MEIFVSTKMDLINNPYNSCVSVYSIGYLYNVRHETQQNLLLYELQWKEREREKNGINEKKNKTRDMHINKGQYQHVWHYRRKEVRIFRKEIRPFIEEDTLTLQKVLTVHSFFLPKVLL